MSDEKHETIADIVSEMREFSDTDSQTIGRDVLRKRIQDFARRIEQSVTDCNRIGNFAKILEALEQIHELLGIGGPPNTAMCIRYEASYQIAKEALSTKPRNCDKYTLEEAFRKYGSPTKGHPWEEIEWRYFCEWLFAEAKGDERNEQRKP